ncbi:hypothetical protein ACFWTE_19425 [Nocardiopsis sp. NPDC058631]|uniref:hypothetical protein n=1 Tax=Nocardiopsis sp. NPDC058631 TaxID=3346566 RepID=UPI003646967D
MRVRPPEPPSPPDPPAPRGPGRRAFAAGALAAAGLALPPVSWSVVTLSTGRR